jgi:hypothetical protein
VMINFPYTPALFEIRAGSLLLYIHTILFPKLFLWEVLQLPEAVSVKQLSQQTNDSPPLPPPKQRVDSGGQVSTKRSTIMIRSLSVSVSMSVSLSVSVSGGLFMNMNMYRFIAHSHVLVLFENCPQ